MECDQLNTMSQQNSERQKALGTGTWLFNWDKQKQKTNKQTLRANTNMNAVKNRGGSIKSTRLVSKTQVFFTD